MNDREADQHTVDQYRQLPRAVGDGANDLPMLSIAGLGIAFRAKPLVRKSAQQSLSRLGLDGILYLLGVRERNVRAVGAALRT